MLENNTLSKEIQDAIKKDLPNQVGTELKKLLDKGQSAMDMVGVFERDFMLQKEILLETQEKVKELTDRSVTLEAIEEREHEVKKKEIEQEVTILKIQLLEANNRDENTLKLVGSLFRNTEFRKEILNSSSSDGFFDNNNNWVPPGLVSGSKTETSTEE